MKSYFDSFYEVIQKNSLKRRRMISLLIVLSMLVTSGVTWGLRDTGITMVNEPICTIEEHQHSDECYETALICDIEESDEHTHSEECFEQTLVCTLEEHSHEVFCYTADTSSVQLEEEEQLPEEQLKVVEIEEIKEDRELSEDEALQAVSTEEIAKLAQPADPENKGFVNTFDNGLDDILINFFDYGNETLEQGTNSWSNPWNLENGPKYEGINSWANNGTRYPESGSSGPWDNANLLFFAYGTPNNNKQTTNPDAGKQNQPPVDHYTPGMNNYSGDYDTTPNISGNRPVAGIVQSTLGGNYPVLSNGNHQSLGYLFAPTTSDTSIKKVYEDVRHLMTKDNKGKYQFISDDHYAYLNENENRFYVYNGTYKIDRGDDEHTGRPIGFFPLDSYDPSRKDPTHNAIAASGYHYNHHFGMTLETPEFTMVGGSQQYKYKGEDIEFAYSGDDDMWVFVDDILILDLGGIHEPAAGQINFTKGYVLTQDNAEGEYTYNDLTKFNLFANGISTDQDLNEDIDLLTGDVMGRAMRGSAGDEKNRYGVRMNVESLAAVYNRNGESLGKKWSPDEPHTLKVFYLERGGSYSNLAMEFNLPFTEKLAVEKEVQNPEDLDEPDMEFHYVLNADQGDGLAPFKGNYDLYDEKGNKIPNPGDEKGHYTTSDAGEFTLKHGQTAVFIGLDRVSTYTVEEVLGYDADIFDVVEIERSEVIGKDLKEYLSFDPSKQSVITEILNINGTEDRSTIGYKHIKFINHVRKENGDVEVEKKWKDNSGNDIDGEFPDIHFKLYRIELDDQGKEIAGSKTIASYNGQRTFVLPIIVEGEKVWTRTFDDLPTRIGRHTYTYTVEELDCPYGYISSKPSSVWNDDQLIITMINIQNTDAHIEAEKDWTGNLPDNVKNHLTVNGKLMREYMEMAAPSPTDLMIIIKDRDGRVITEQKVDTAYLDGNLEFTLNKPNNVNITTPNSELGSNCSVSRDGMFFEVSDIQENATVTIQVDAAVINEPIVRYSFTNSNDGWTNRGRCTTINRANGGMSAYDFDVGGKNGRLFVELVDRVQISARPLQYEDFNADYNGVQVKLDPAKFEAGKTYSFYTQVIGTGTTGTQKLKFQLSTGTSAYPLIKETDGLKQGEWTPISGSVMIPADTNMNELNLYVQSNIVANFYVDEVVVAPAGVDISVEPGSGKLTLSGGSDEYKITINDDSITSPPKTTGDWVPDSDWNNSSDSDIVLTSASDWKQIWNNNVLKQLPGRKYRYYIVENSVISDDPQYNLNLDSFKVKYLSVDPNDPDTWVEFTPADSPMVIENEFISYTLPSTGGIGTIRIRMIGAGLILLGIMSVCVSKKRGKKDLLNADL